MANETLNVTTLGGALAATGTGIIAIVAYLDKLRKDAKADQTLEGLENERRLNLAVKIVGEQIDVAAKAGQWTNVNALRKVQSALVDDH